MDLHSIAFILLVLAGLSMTTPAVSLIFLSLAIAAVSARD